MRVQTVGLFSKKSIKNLRNSGEVLFHYLQLSSVQQSGRSGRLVHLAHELVDELLAVARHAALGEVRALVRVAAEGRAELEGPEEVVGLLEVGAAGHDLVDQVLLVGGVGW